MKSLACLLKTLHNLIKILLTWFRDEFHFCTNTLSTGPMFIFTFLYSLLPNVVGFSNNYYLIVLEKYKHRELKLNFLRADH
jgi:hypothetical protein